MRWHGLIVLAATLASSSVRAQEAFKVEVLKEPPPATLSPAVKGELNLHGYRMVNAQGNSYADFWLRKAVPASGKPAGAKGTIQFPILVEGELLGALRFPGEGHDYRDQAIPPGVYSLRYGLQPLNGDHLGITPFRDYVLLLPSLKDTAVASPAQKKLQEQSAESAGASHPAVLMLLADPSDAKGEPVLLHDEAKNTSGAVFPLSLAVKGEAAPVPLSVQLVLVGMATT